MPSNPKAMPKSDRVKYLGPVKGLGRYLAAADIFVLPTLYEPFSNACLRTPSPHQRLAKNRLSVAEFTLTIAPRGISFRCAAPPRVVVSRCDFQAVSSAAANRDTLRRARRFVGSANVDVEVQHVFPSAQFGVELNRRRILEIGLYVDDVRPTRGGDHLQVLYQRRRNPLTPV